MDIVSLIYKVLSGKANASEMMVLDEWITRNPANKAEFDDILLLWVSSAQDPTAHTSGGDQGFEKIKARIKARARRQNWSRSLMKTTLIIVAALFFLLLDHVTSVRTHSEGLRFNDVAVENIVNIIEDRYNIHIEVENRDLLKCRLTLVLYRMNSYDEAVKSLGQALNVEVARVNSKTYKLSGSGCG